MINVNPPLTDPPNHILIQVGAKFQQPFSLFFHPMVGETNASKMDELGSPSPYILGMSIVMSSLPLISVISSSLPTFLSSLLFFLGIPSITSTNLVSIPSILVILTLIKFVFGVGEIQS